MEGTTYKFYNAHPEGKRVNDCVKRAITLVANMDYHQVQLELNRYKKVTGAKSYNSGYNPHKYCENILKMEKLSFPAEKGKDRMNGERFTRAYPKGRYILNMAGHWTACIDGTIYDTWDCRDKCVYTAYKMRDSKELMELKAQEQKAQEQAILTQQIKEKQKLQAKRIKEKYSKKIKPLQKKIKELEKLMAKELEAIKEVR